MKQKMDDKLSECYELDAEDGDGFKTERSSTIGAYYDIAKAKSSVLSGTDQSGASGTQPTGELAPITSACRPAVTLSWRNVCARVSVAGKKQRKAAGGQTKVVLDGVSGLVRPGELLAIMGASGAGKSTLLNVLLGLDKRALSVTGDVRVNGVPVRPAGSSVAYVHQDDLFVGALTVREHLLFQAVLRLPASLPLAEKRQRAKAAARHLGLGKCLDTHIGLPGVVTGVSGGERKRLALATELLADPPLLVCDEPTTGLDSYMAESVVLHLQRLAASGKTVLCTVHQPASEIYALFHKLVLLADGRLAFYGSTEQALEHFATALGRPCPTDYNPADHFIENLAIKPNDEESVERVHALCDSFAQSTYAQTLMEELDEISRPTDAEKNVDSDSEPMLDQRSYATNPFVQFVAILWRSLLYNYRNPVVAFARIFQRIVIGILIALMFSGSSSKTGGVDQAGVQNIRGVTYFISFSLTTAAMMGVLRLVPAEYPLLVREHHKHLYSVWAWYAAKAVSIVPVYSVDGALMIAICYFPVGLRPDPAAFLTALVIGAACEQVGAAFGNMMASVCPNFITALAVVGPLSQIMSQTAGLFANLAALPAWLSWLQYTSFRRYAYEAMSVNQWARVGNLTCLPTDHGCLTDGAQVLEQLGFAAPSAWYDLLILLAYILLLHVIGYAGLLARVVRAK